MENCVLGWGPLVPPSRYPKIFSLGLPPHPQKIPKTHADTIRPKIKLSPTTHHSNYSGYFLSFVDLKYIFSSTLLRDPRSTHSEQGGDMYL